MDIDRAGIFQATSLLLLLCIACYIPDRVTAAETYVLDNANSPHSHFLVATDTAGLVGFMGHRHAILAAEWRAKVALDLQNLATLAIDLSVETDSLILDSERAYSLAGFDKAIPPQADREATMQRIVGPDILNVSENPVIRFQSEAITHSAVDADGIVTLSIAGMLQLRGDYLPPAPLEVTVRMEQSMNRLIIDGSVEILQSEFGLKPFSFAGIMKVKDQIDIIWHLEIEGYE